MLQRSIQSVFEVTGNGSENLASQTTLLELTFHDSFDLCIRWLLELENDPFPPLQNYCACHAKRGRVTFAPTLGSAVPLPPPSVGANASPHEVGANATPVPKKQHRWDPIALWQRQKPQKLGLPLRLVARYKEIHRLKEHFGRASSIIQLLLGWANPFLLGQKSGHLDAHT